MKKALSILLTVSALTGCFDKKLSDEQKDAELSEPLTLIGKDFIPRTWNYGARCFLYFSLTGNTNKVDVIAVKSGCLVTQARYFEAKIGDRKKISEWRTQFTHPKEDFCDEHFTRGNNLRDHEFSWKRVRE